MNPNNRFRKKSDHQEEIYVYDIEEHSHNIVKEEVEKERKTKNRKQISHHYFLKRFIAFVLDVIAGTVFLTVLCFIMSIALILGVFRGDWYDVAQLFQYVSDWSWFFIFGLVFFTKVNFILALLTTFCQLIFMSLFFAFFESSSSSATLGKRVVGLKVIKEDGEKLKYDESFKRNFLRFLLFPLIGFLSDEKRAYHNSWTGAVVVKSNETYKI